MKRILVLVALAFALSCSKDNGTAPNEDSGGTTGGGKVTALDSLRVQTVRNIAAQLDQWDSLGEDSIAARAVPYLKSLPSIKDAGITPGTTSVWALFKDDVPLIIPNNREPSAQSDTLIDDSFAAIRPAPSTPAPRRRAIPAGRSMKTALLVPTRSLELPVPATFRAYNAIGPCFVNPLPVVRSLLKDGNYVDAHPGAPTVQELKRNVHGDGVFYINTHGGAGFGPLKIPIYALWTMDAFDSLAVVPVYNDMLHRDEVVVMVEKGVDAELNCHNVGHYGITAQFVNRYMSFGKNSVVIIDACSSASVGAIDMRQAFENAGASVYVGWTRSVDAGFAYKAMKYLIDRLLGVNVISPEDPKQRAFNIDQVLKDMKDNRNLVDDPHDHAILTSFRMKGDFGLLSPSIQFLSIDLSTGSSQLVIAGIFGTDPGEGNRAVKINGQSLNVVEWEPTLITCDIPDTGDDAAGTVVVEVGSGAHPRRSNEVNLTEWKGELTYERDDPGEQHVAMTLKIHFRADIHSFREEPHETPFETTVLFSAMHDASAVVTSGGSYTTSDGPCVNTYVIAGGVTLPSPYEPTADGGWNYFGSVDSQTHTLQLNMYILAGFDGSKWIRTGPAECGVFTAPSRLIVRIEDCLFDDLVGVTAFRMQMDPDYAVQADDRGPCSVHPLFTPLFDLAAQVSIHWDAMDASYPPDPDAAR